jgi:CubicO group peptidase (beta-lactamase class C family)
LFATAAFAAPTPKTNSPPTGPSPTGPASTPAGAPSPAGVPPSSNPGGSAHPLERADLEVWMDGFMPYAIENGDIAGAVVEVVKDGEVIFEKGYGYADVEARTAVDPKSTMFRPGSVSKLFTWTAVMQLVEQGKLDLDRNVNDYLDFKIPDRADGPITLRNIMTHTAGFEEQVKSLIAEDPKALIPLREYAKNFTPTRIFKAGSTPAYSNYATAVAGYLVEHVSGQSFDDYLDEHIFKPLGMMHATFRQPLPERFNADMAKGYALASEPPKPYEYVVPAPAGSLAASGDDMAKFMIAHLQNGEYQGARILKPETARMMHATPTDMIPHLNRMLLGFYEQNYNGHRIISHGGDTQYMHSYLHLYPDDNVGLFMSFNSLGREGAAGSVRQALFDEFTDRYFPGKPLEGSVSAETAAAHARLMAGYYDDSRRPDRSFLSILALIAPVRVQVVKDNELTVSLIKERNGQPRHYKEIAPFLWRDTNSNWLMAAKVVDGKPVRISMGELSPFMVFDPVPGSRSPAWLQPAAVIAYGAVLLTTLLWPVAAIVRRRYKMPLALPPLAAKARLRSRITAVALTLISSAWPALVMLGLSSLGVFTAGLDPWLWLLYLLSVVVYVGGALVMLWCAYVTWSTPRPWTARLWTTVLAASALVLLYLAWTYHLMSFKTHY